MPRWCRGLPSSREAVGRVGERVSARRGGGRAKCTIWPPPDPSPLASSRGRERESRPLTAPVPPAGSGRCRHRSAGRSRRPGLAHVADALAETVQQPLLLHDLLAVELEPHQQLSGERRRRTGCPARPETGRRCRTPCRTARSTAPSTTPAAPCRPCACCRRILAPSVVDAVADHRPAVVLSLLRDVDLVAAARPVLGLPQLAGLRIDRERPASCDGRSSRSRACAPALADERIVGRHRTVRRMRTILPMVVGEILRLVATAEVIAHGDEQIAVGRLHDAAAEVLPRDSGPSWRKMIFTSSSRGVPSSTQRARARRAASPPVAGSSKQK